MICLIRYLGVLSMMMGGGGGCSWLLKVFGYLGSS